MCRTQKGNTRLKIKKLGPVRVWPSFCDYLHHSQYLCVGSIIRSLIGLTNVALVRLVPVRRATWRLIVPTCSPSRGGDVAVYVLDINRPSLPAYSVLVSISVFVSLSTVFHSTNSPNHSPLSHSVLPVLFLPYWPFNYISLYESLLQPWYNPLFFILF